MKNPRKVSLVILVSLLSFITSVHSQEVIRGGLKGALVGGILGDGKGAKRGAFLGGALAAGKKIERTEEREAQLRREAQIRSQQQAVEDYKNSQRVDLSGPPQAPNPEFLHAAPAATSAPKAVVPAEASGASVIMKDGSPYLSIEFPDDWKKVASKSAVTAMTNDGLVWAIVGEVPGAKTLDEGEKAVKAAIQERLNDVTFDETIPRNVTSKVIHGKGTEKTKGLPVLIGAGVFAATSDSVATIVFFTDPQANALYSATMLDICESIQTEGNFQ